MRRAMFLAAVVLGLCVAICARQVVFAKCRCNGGSRKAAKQQRKCERRGNCSPQFVQPDGGGGTYYNPYGGDAITPTWGSARPAAPPQYTVTQRWVYENGDTGEQRCFGTYCRTVRIPKPPEDAKVPAPAPVPDPAFKGVKAPEAPAKTAKEEAKADGVGVFPPGVLPGT